MPFEIGKAVSDNTMNLIARKREEDRNAQLEAYRLELARRAQMSGDQQALRELQLSYARLGGEGEDRALRRDLAAQEAEREGRRLDLSERAQGFAESMGEREFGEGTRRFDVGAEANKRELDLRQAGQEAENFFNIHRSQTTDRELDLRQRGLEEDEKSNRWKRDVEFPATVDMKKQELSRKAEDSASKRAVDDARVVQLRALAENAARRGQALAAAGNAGQAVKELQALTRAYDSAANGINGPNPELAEQIQAQMLAVLDVIKKANPGMYSTVQRTMGVELGRAMGDPFATTGYGAADSVVDALMKPPAVPR